MKKIVAGAACVLLAGTMALCSACSLFTGTSADSNYPSDVAVSAGEYGSAENWLAAQETPSTYERRLYEEAVADGSFTGTYYEFLASLGLSSEDDTAYLSRALCSSVAIEVRFPTADPDYSSVSDGSGVIYSLDKEAGEAYIVTNYHVVASSLGGYVTMSWSSVTLTLYGGQEIVSSRGDGTVTLVGGNNLTSDIAVLRVRSNILGESSAMAAEYANAVLGEEAYAVGNAEGEGLSVTRGVVSVLSETVEIEAADGITPVTLNAMRTDAAINHGNSGGGLFNERGELLGIVTARREGAGTVSVDGFGYAIPAQDVNAVLGQLSCGSIDAAQQETSVGSRALLDRDAAAQRAAYCVVAIVANDGMSTSRSAGSGVIYDLDKEAGDAYIITNYHVVYSDISTSGICSQLNVYLYGDDTGVPIAASYVGGVMAEDIAVLCIEDSAVLAASPAQEAVAADSSSLTVGEDVYAVGNAEGEGISLSQGVVSVPGEYINIASADDSETLTLYGIRTDAAVNHGNSGGGLFNEMGELVGVVYARSDEEDIVGFGYAIPANRALLIAQNVIDNAPYSQGAAVASLGVTVYTYASRAVFNGTTGKTYLEEKVVVRGLSGAGTAAKMGLDVNDTLVSARIERGGQTVLSAALTRTYQLGEMMYAVRLGDTLHITVSRGGQTQEYSYTFSSVTNFAQAV